MTLDVPPWLIGWLQTVSFWDAIIWAIGIVALVIFVRKKGWRWIIAFARAILATAEVIDNVKELPAFIAEQREIAKTQNATLEEHTRQLKNSHHSNLRDDVTRALEAAERTEQSVEGLHGRMDNVEAQVTALARADDEIRAELEQTQNPHSEEENP